MYETAEKSCWPVTFRALIVALAVGLIGSVLVGFDGPPQQQAAVQATDS